MLILKIFVLCQFEHVLQKCTICQRGDNEILGICKISSYLKLVDKRPRAKITV
jgi:hypothetical protein